MRSSYHAMRLHLQVIALCALAPASVAQALHTVLLATCATPLDCAPLLAPSPPPPTPPPTPLDQSAVLHVLTSAGTKQACRMPACRHHRQNSDGRSSPSPSPRVHNSLMVQRTTQSLRSPFASRAHNRLEVVVSQSSYEKLEAEDGHVSSAEDKV
jgi:hypothetical protein